MKGQVTFSVLTGVLILMISIISVAPIIYAGINSGWSSFSLFERLFAVFFVPSIMIGILMLPANRSLLVGRGKGGSFGR